MKLHMLRDMRLNEDSSLLGVQPGTEPIKKNFPAVLPNTATVGIIRHQCMPVYYAVKAFVLVLQFNPVGKSSGQMTEVQLSGRTHPAENPFCHYVFTSFFLVVFRCNMGSSEALFFLLF
jgi:hypothetical protein